MANVISSGGLVGDVLREDNLYTLLKLASEVPLGELYAATSKLLFDIRSQIPSANDTEAKQAALNAENKLKQALLLQVKERVAKQGIQNAFGVTGTDTLQVLEAKLVISGYDTRVHNALLKNNKTFYPSARVATKLG